MNVPTSGILAVAPASELWGENFWLSVHLDDSTTLASIARSHGWTTERRHLAPLPSHLEADAFAVTAHFAEAVERRRSAADPKPRWRKLRPSTRKAHECLPRMQASVRQRQT
jgi:hypothetical protein